VNPIVDYLVHSGQLGVFLLVAWYVIKRVNRDDSIKADYPPHRHINGSILYPPEYAPGTVERTNGAAAGSH
jgi:hypothetical protein